MVDPDVLEADGAERVALKGLDEIDHQAIARHGGAVHVQVGVAVPVVLVRTVVKPRAIKMAVEPAELERIQQAVVRFRNHHAGRQPEPPCRGHRVVHALAHNLHPRIDAAPRARRFVRFGGEDAHVAVGWVDTVVQPLILELCAASVSTVEQADNWSSCALTFTQQKGFPEYVSVKGMISLSPSSLTLAASVLKFATAAQT